MHPPANDLTTAESTQRDRPWRRSWCSACWRAAGPDPPRAGWHRHVTDRVAAVCRSRWAVTAGTPARPAALVTIADNPVAGQLTSPTSAGSGNPFLTIAAFRGPESRRGANRCRICRITASDPTAVGPQTRSHGPSRPVRFRVGCSHQVAVACSKRRNPRRCRRGTCPTEGNIRGGQRRAHDRLLAAFRYVAQLRLVSLRNLVT